MIGGSTVQSMIDSIKNNRAMLKNHKHLIEREKSDGLHTPIPHSSVGASDEVIQYERKLRRSRRRSNQIRSWLSFVLILVMLLFIIYGVFWKLGD